MSDWNPYVLTNNGRKLLAKTGIIDNALTFLNFRTSSHVYTDSQLPSLASLEDVQGTFGFGSKEIVDETTVKLETIVSNKDVKTAYTWATAGVYASDSNGNEVLFAVATAKKTIEMRPVKESTLNQFIITVYLQTNSTDKIQIYVEPTSFVTTKALQQFQDSITNSLALLEKKVYNVLFPVGRVITDFGDTDPNIQFPWMTWEKIGEGSALVSAGSSYKVGDVLGSNSKPVPQECLPRHTHAAESDLQGEHTHSGSTSQEGKHRHRFWLDARVANHDDDGENLNDVNHGGWGQEPCWTSTSGGHIHTVKLDKTGSHRHNITIDYAGEGENFDVMQQSILVYVWRRTA